MPELAPHPPEPYVQDQPRDDREAEDEGQHDRAQENGAHRDDGADDQTGQLEQRVPGDRESVHGAVILPLW